MRSFRKKGRVSVWVGSVRVDSGIDLLKNLCGIDHYNLDDQEVMVDNQNWERQRVEALLRPISYSNSFLHEALAAATSMGITEALYVICQFDFAYDPEKIAKDVAPDPIFLGHFAWNDLQDEKEKGSDAGVESGGDAVV